MKVRISDKVSLMKKRFQAIMHNNKFKFCEQKGREEEKRRSEGKWSVQRDAPQPDNALD